MSDPLSLALAVLELLLGAAVVTALMSGSAALKKFAHAPLVVTCGAAAVLAIILVSKVAAAGDAPRFVSEPLTWFAAGKFTV
ncbi:MAG TPA: NADH-quinone oxidoreductase subunit L, partial [Urbifossiella sp.]|nr:NADH-quinone oxidoreductase subunit L [Urbifossiella sp.]